MASRKNKKIALGPKDAAVIFQEAGGIRMVGGVEDGSPKTLMSTWNATLVVWLFSGHPKALPVLDSLIKAAEEMVLEGRAKHEKEQRPDSK
jgi:hypothetical protein